MAKALALALILTALSTLSPMALARDCSGLLSHTSHIQMSSTFKVWMKNADDDEYIEFVVILSNGDVHLGSSSYVDKNVLHVSGPAFPQEDYTHRMARLLSLVRSSPIALRSAHYVEPLAIGIVHFAGNRDAIRDLINTLRTSKDMGSLQFSFR